METRRTNKGGRPALADPAKHRHVLYLNDRENARFLSQWEQSGVTSKSRFIAARLFGEPFRVVKVDKSAVEYCARLTELINFPKYFLISGVPRSAIISRKILVSRAIVPSSVASCSPIDGSLNWVIRMEESE